MKIEKSILKKKQYLHVNGEKNILKNVCSSFRMTYSITCIFFCQIHLRLV